MKSEIIEKLSRASKPYCMPDESIVSGISFKQTTAIAREFGVAQGDLEIAALKNKIIPERYIRNMRSLSMDDQIRLLESGACVVGLGGLGGTVVETLTRIGIGEPLIACQGGIS